MYKLSLQRVTAERQQRENVLSAAAQAYGRRAVAAAGGQRRRGSVGAGHAGGASRVAELGARHAAADDDAVLKPALGLLRPRVRVIGELAVVQVIGYFSDFIFRGKISSK